MQSVKIGKRGIAAEVMIKIALWIVFLVLASGVVVYLVKKLTS